VQESGELKKSCDILGYSRTKCNLYKSDNFTSGIFYKSSEDYGNLDKCEGGVIGHLHLTPDEGRT